MLAGDLELAGALEQLAGVLLGRLGLLSPTDLQPGTARSLRQRGGLAGRLA